jgi:hypothetical protein
MGILMVYGRGVAERPYLTIRPPPLLPPAGSLVADFTKPPVVGRAQ